MQNKLKNEKLFYALIYICFYIFFLILSMHITNMGDDLVFQKGIERYGGFIGWIKFFSHNWGGRVIPQGILVLLLQGPELLFHLVDAFMWVVLLNYTHKNLNCFTRLNKGVSMAIVAIAIFTIIPNSVLMDSVFWKCANVLYLWGTAMCFVAIYPLILYYHNKPVKKIDFIFALAACVYAASFEQVAVFMSVAVLLLFITALLKNKVVSFKCLVLLILSLAATFFFCTMPGNSLRTEIEVLGQLQKFDMFSVYDKALLAINYAISNSQAQIPQMFVALSLIVCIAFCKFRTEYNKVFMLIGISLVGYFTVKYACQISGTIPWSRALWISKLYNLVQVDTTQFAIAKSAIAGQILNVIMVALLGACLSVIIPKQYDIISFIWYFGGLATLATMGFSPTIYASGERPRFLGYLLIILAVYRSLSSLCEYLNSDTFKRCAADKQIELS